jgi:spoIIIJ-associated protein
MDKKTLTTVKTTLEELMTKIGIAVEVKVSFDEDEEIVLVDLSSPDNALLVGYHGKNLAAIQTILGLMVYRKIDQWLHILIDIDGYRAKRQAQVEEMARRAVDQAKSTGQSIAIANLGPQERRQIHLLFKDDPAIETHSEGEGRNRQLIVSLK